MKFIISIFIGLFLVQSSVIADTKLVEKNFLEAISEVELTIKEKTLSKDIRNKKVIEIIEPQFDFELMAKLSLGKKWKSLQKDVREEFVELYVNRMKKSYSSKLDAYQDEKFIVSGLKQPKATRIFLISKIQSGTDDFEIVYKYYKPKKPIENKKQWLIYDVEILGVSILKTDRAQFSEYLKTHTLDDLMKSMKE